MLRDVGLEEKDRKTLEEEGFATMARLLLLREDNLKELGFKMAERLALAHALDMRREDTPGTITISDLASSVSSNAYHTPPAKGRQQCTLLQ